MVSCGLLAMIIVQSVYYGPSLLLLQDANEVADLEVILFTFIKICIFKYREGGLELIFPYVYLERHSDVKGHTGRNDR